MISESGNKEEPPILTAFIRISSALKSVFFRTTFAPLDSVMTVVPKGPFSLMETILPALGFSVINGSSETLSTYASIFSAFMSFIVFNISSFVGYFMFSLSGQKIETTRFESEISCPII